MFQSPALPVEQGSAAQQTLFQGVMTPVTQVHWARSLTDVGGPYLSVSRHVWTLLLATGAPPDAQTTNQLPWQRLFCRSSHSTPREHSSTCCHLICVGATGNSHKDLCFAWASQQRSWRGNSLFFIATHPRQTPWSTVHYLNLHCHSGFFSTARPSKCWSGSSPSAPTSFMRMKHILSSIECEICLSMQFIFSA